VKPSGGDLTVAQIVDNTAKARGDLTSFRGDSTMDYWLSGQRAKGEVLVMGTTGKKVRFAALSPAGGATLAEMACDGTNFVYVDYQNNCSLTGPCDARSIATFFGIELEPDDFLHLALGTPPIVNNAQGTSTWDSSRGVWKADLKGTDGSQTLAIDNKENRWDVVETELKGTDGTVRWSVKNTDFEKVNGSGERRVPKKTQFKSPVGNQDLLVEWQELEVNGQLPAAKFVLTPPAGLPTCGGAPPTQMKAPATKP
jgi:outer membrane lipoprotein-sorting protein